MNVDEDEITAGGIAVHRQAMVLRRHDNNNGHGNRGVRFILAITKIFDSFRIVLIVYTVASEIF